jgi:hypothetical protein
MSSIAISRIVCCVGCSGNLSPAQLFCHLMFYIASMCHDVSPRLVIIYSLAERCFNAIN